MSWFSYWIVSDWVIKGLSDWLIKGLSDWLIKGLKDLELGKWVFE